MLLATLKSDSPCTTSVAKQVALNLFLLPSHAAHCCVHRWLIIIIIITTIIVHLAGWEEAAPQEPVYFWPFVTSSLPNIACNTRRAFVESTPHREMPCPREPIFTQTVSEHAVWGCRCEGGGGGKNPLCASRVFVQVGQSWLYSW